ncbi:MAG TPA: phosphoribosylanthranilate isomerase [Syntrophales bacterium]|nr:phosphoribosylanthranilate isomerase [Syntrophales bacterium]
MEIKICGITNMEDAIMALSHGADALGFIFYRKSPRYLTPEAALRIIHELPDTISKVGVFVNHDIYAVRQIYEFCGLDMIQLHGDESPEYCGEFPQSILIKAISPGNEEDLYALNNYNVGAFMIDAREAGIYGGTGKKSNWDLAAKLKDTHPVVLSGGLNAGNILQAIRTVSPGAVDVNSSIELSPGKKDLRKVQSIIELVHAAARQSSRIIFTRRKHATVTTR